ncbi:hypothetical protein BGZ51_004097, partial [Haplosporangium sp. Z 767]
RHLPLELTHIGSLQTTTLMTFQIRAGSITILVATNLVRAAPSTAFTTTAQTPASVSVMLAIDLSPALQLPKASSAAVSPLLLPPTWEEDMGESCKYANSDLKKKIFMDEDTCRQSRHLHQGTLEQKRLDPRLLCLISV